jgi:hypothetical protein
MSSKSDATELAAVLALENTAVAPAQVAADVRRLLSLATRVQRIAENECNGIERYDEKLGRRLAQWTAEDQHRADKEIIKARAEAMKIADRYHATVARCGGDPRGYTLALNLVSHKSNSWTNFWGIPS